MANIRIIQPQGMREEPLRVAAYCRVSSDSSDQLHSYATQIRYYAEMIGQHRDWELVDVYADEALTGTRMDKREDFNRMLSDCRGGRIDQIMVKSISRFARNTRDCLITLRELSMLGIPVYFEKENINTATLSSELMVSVFGALAQEESISISKNQRISYQRRMQSGEYITNSPPFGYRIKDGKNLEIVDAEARMVRWIFDQYLAGKSTLDIAEEMNHTDFQPHFHAGRWWACTINYILRNEKYIGDSLCQKQYTTDSLPLTRKRNHGHRDQYYVEATHEAIVSMDTFDKVQELLALRGSKVNTKKQNYPLARKMTCGKCGATLFRRKTKGGYTTWVCRTHLSNIADCRLHGIPEQAIYDAFVRMYNKMKRNQKTILEPALMQLDALNAAMQRDNPAMLEINTAIAETAEQNYKISKLQAEGLIDAEACTGKLREINVRMTELRRKRRAILKNEKVEETADAIRQVTNIIQNGPEDLKDFDELLFNDLVEKITAASQTEIMFHIRGDIILTERLGTVSGR